MKILTQFELNGKASYPDDYRLFSNMEQVEIKDELYWLCDYTGSMDLENGTYTYESWQKSLSIPVITLSNFILKANNTKIIPQAGIYWIGSGDSLTVTADITDESKVLSSILGTSGSSKVNMVVMSERIRSGDFNDVIDDVRFGVEMDAVSMLLESSRGFDIGGNYVITQERLNQGLEILDAPFRVSLSPVEFDVLNK